MIKYEIDQIKEIAGKGLAKIEDFEDTINKFEAETEDLLTNNSDDYFFPKFEEKTEGLIKALRDFAIEDMTHLFNYINAAMEVTVEVDEKMKGEIDK